MEKEFNYIGVKVDCRGNNIEPTELVITETDEFVTAKVTFQVADESKLEKPLSRNFYSSFYKKGYGTYGRPAQEVSRIAFCPGEYVAEFILTEKG